MALLLATLVAFGRLSSDSEIIALRASGVSLYRLLEPVGLFAGVVTILTLGLSVYARPWGNSRLRTGLYEIVKARASAGIKPHVFNDEFAGLVIYVDHIEPPGNNLEGILISDTRDQTLHNTVFARSGVLFSSERNHTLTLRLFNGGMFSASARSGEYQDTRFKTYDINLDLGTALAQLKARPKDASEMTVPELKIAIASEGCRWRTKSRRTRRTAAQVLDSLCLSCFCRLGRAPRNPTNTRRTLARFFGQPIPHFSLLSPVNPWPEPRRTRNASPPCRGMAPQRDSLRLRSNAAGARRERNRGWTTRPL